MNQKEKVKELAKIIEGRETPETIALACVSKDGIKYLANKHAAAFICSVKWSVGTFLRDADTWNDLRLCFLRKYKNIDFETFIKIIEK